MEKKWITTLSICLLVSIIFSTTAVFADAVEGDAIVSLGADLTEAQQREMLKRFHPPKDATLIKVTNKEEHRYLGTSIPAGKIGNKAISSSMVTYTKKGSGIMVDVDGNITYITPGTYRNALITAGVEDADIKVGSPVKVTGTAALTGIMKAYEVNTGEKIPDKVKEVANKEMVLSSKMKETLGEEKTNDLMNTIKVQMAEKTPKTSEEVRTIIQNITNQYNINLTQEQTTQLVGLFEQMQKADIDWNKVEQNAKKYSKIAAEYANKAKDYLGSPEGQKKLEESKGWFNAFIDWIKSLFKK